MWEFGFRVGRFGLLAVRPDSLAYGHLALETKYAITTAAQERCLLYLARSPGSVNPAICDLVAPGVRRVPNFWPVDYLITVLERRQKAAKRRRIQEQVQERRQRRRPEVQARLEREKFRAREMREQARERDLIDIRRRKRLGLPGDSPAAEREFAIRLALRRYRLQLSSRYHDILLLPRLSRQLPPEWRRKAKKTRRHIALELDRPPHLDRIGSRPEELFSLRLRPIAGALRALRPEPLSWPVKGLRILPPDDPLYYLRRLAGAPVYATLPDRSKRRADRIAEELGVGNGQPLVTVHFRDSGFKRGRDKTEITRLNLQNTSVENCLPAIRDLVARGYAVVRLGDSSMTPVSEPGVVDLATSPLREPFLDPYFIARGEFMIGCDSGPAIMAWLLGTPLIYMNASHPAHCWPLGPNDLMVPKYIRVSADNHYQTLEEMCTLEGVKHFRDPAFLAYEELTAADFHEAVREMLARLGPEGGYVTSPLQGDFKRNCVRFLESPGLPDYLKKWACRDGFLGHGTIARFVVERNRLGGWAPTMPSVLASASEA